MYRPRPAAHEPGQRRCGSEAVTLQSGNTERCVSSLLPGHSTSARAHEQHALFTCQHLSRLRPKEGPFKLCEAPESLSRSRTRSGQDLEGRSVDFTRRSVSRRTNKRWTPQDAQTSTGCLKTHKQALDASRRTNKHWTPQDAQTSTGRLKTHKQALDASRRTKSAGRLKMPDEEVLVTAGPGPDPEEVQVQTLRRSRSRPRGGPAPVLPSDHNRSQSKHLSPLGENRPRIITGLSLLDLGQDCSWIVSCKRLSPLGLDLSLDHNRSESWGFLLGRLQTHTKPDPR
ncbi:hypothetical protein WMY93_033113 [Mugilogobius chulae]|uniref:Uncharacterized protein n=1 Tax=Mugilogobius chulae TaxID=88201 RepID=A0AAW0MM61_9GOBI